MNVSQLIEELKKYDGNLPVKCSAEGGNIEVPIEWVCPLSENDKITNSLPHYAILLGED